MKSKKPTLEEIVQFCIHLQDDCGFDANVAATAFLEKYNLSGVGSLHQKLTKNPDSAYEERN